MVFGSSAPAAGVASISFPGFACGSGWTSIANCANSSASGSCVEEDEGAGPRRRTRDGAAENLDANAVHALAGLVGSVGSKGEKNEYRKRERRRSSSSIHRVSSRRRRRPGSWLPRSSRPSRFARTQEDPARLDRRRAPLPLHAERAALAEGRRPSRGVSGGPWQCSRSCRSAAFPLRADRSGRGPRHLPARRARRRGAADPGQLPPAQRERPRLDRTAPGEGAARRPPRRHRRTLRLLRPPPEGNPSQASRVSRSGASTSKRAPSRPTSTCGPRISLKAGTNAPDASRFPDTMVMRAGSRTCLSPCSGRGRRCGVTVRVPVAAVNRIDTDLFEWLVPGLGEGHRTPCGRCRSGFACVSSRPPNTRAGQPRRWRSGRGLAAGPRTAPDGARRCGVAEPTDFDFSDIPPHLRMRVLVVEGERTLAEGRDANEVR